MSNHAVSLFSNCGAGDLGFGKAGFQFTVMGELEFSRIEVCKWNHPGARVVAGDLRTSWSEVVETYRDQTNHPPALLTACPPCQGMSTARGGLGKGNDPDDGIQDERNLLVEVIADVAKALEPQMIVIENVVRFLTRKVHHPDTQEPISAAKLLIERLNTDYSVFPFITDLADYGVPQTRRRTFLTFLRKQHQAVAQLHELELAPYPAPSHAGKAKRLRDALTELNLPELDARSKRKAHDDETSLHFVPVWDSDRYRMVDLIPPGSGSSAWKNDCPNCEDVEIDDEAAHCPQCGELLPRPVMKDDDGSYRLVKGFRRSSYRRMDPNEPAPTVTTASGRMSSDINIHPFENRVLSPIECAHLQTFPRDFKWESNDGEIRAVEEWGVGAVREMIGEAVPPLFTRKHGEVLIALLEGQHEATELISVGDERCLVARERLGLPEAPELPFEEEPA